MNPDRLPELPSDLKSLEADLAALAPATGELNRDELMYRAGWEAHAAAESCRLAVSSNNRRGGHAWLWPLTTGALVLLSATLGIVLAMRQPDLEIVYVERPANGGIKAAQERSSTTASELSSEDAHVASAQEPSPVHTPRLVGAPTRFGNDYLSLRERVLAFGVDMLPSPSGAPLPSESPTIGDSRYGALIGQLRGG